MWPKLTKQIDVELEELHQLLATHRPLLERCRSVPPSAIETSALAALLHSFYNGLENMFKRVAVEVDADPPLGDNWHRKLLDAMIAPTGLRPPVITPATHQQLLDYLSFRHVFRHAYSFRLRWEKMAALVHDCEGVLRQVEAEIRAFLTRAHAT